MKIQGSCYWNRLDIHLIPIVCLRIGVPSILNLKYKFHYREITLGFKWLGIIAIVQINF